MPQTITLFIRLEDQPTDPASDPDLLYKRGDIFQVHIYAGETPKAAANFGLVTVSGIPDDLTLQQLRHIVTSIDADYDETGGENQGRVTAVRGRCLINIDIDGLPGGERNILTGAGVRMLTWNAAQFLSRVNIRGHKNRKILLADLYEDYG